MANGRSTHMREGRNRRSVVVSGWHRPAGLAALVVMFSFAAACGGSSSAAGVSGGPCKPAATPVLTLAAYSNPYDAYGKLTSSFASDWKDSHNGQSLIFQMSFGGSTTQATNIVNGFPADIYASSLAPDVGLVQKAGLITHN